MGTSHQGCIAADKHSKPFVPAHWYHSVHTQLALSPKAAVSQRELLEQMLLSALTNCSRLHFALQQNWPWQSLLALQH